VCLNINHEERPPRCKGVIHPLQYGRRVDLIVDGVEGRDEIESGVRGKLNCIEYLETYVR
jgi:hypothetical protein